LQIGEAFIMGMEDADYQKALEEKDMHSLADHLVLYGNRLTRFSP
jgi:hypothetical protein